MIQFLEQFDIIIVGIICSLAAGLLTGVGALPVFFKRDISRKLLDSFLGFAAGVMLAATSFSLIVPAIEAGGGGVYGALITLIGIVIGGVFVDVIDRCFPDTNLYLGPSKNHSNLRKIWLFTLAITIHNFPEGLAVGVGFGSGSIANGLSLAIAIGLQNIPEGLAVALPFLCEGFPVGKAFLIALLTGLVEPLGGLLGVGLVNLARPLLPLGLSFAAGAMLFVISHEIIPETHKEESSKLTTHSLIIGFVIMMFLDNVLG
ncbi:MAG TPA: ZIP family metal transporter [Bacillota bacterium]|jgi:ZIP family zinc transporter|nr:ZIP family metal transporter [Bacillota bacterium]HOL10145.1 ZIP family metal transporter [Bacillota bacterium]HPO97920.1 ZIP family metal transporter [Bacillota bacterium]